MVGAYGGAWLAALPWVTDALQMTLFAVAMLVAAVLMIRRRPPEPDLAAPYVSLVCPYCWLLLVGLLTGGVVLPLSRRWCCWPSCL